MKRYYKNIIWILLILLIWTPFVQMQFNLFSEKELNGAVEKAEFVPLKSQSWFDESFQTNNEDYVNENFGFRKELVRLHNQINYSLFNKLNTSNIYEGKNGYFFRFYMDGFNDNTNFIGDKRINEWMTQLKMLTDTLNKKGIKVITLIAPGKHRFMPENLPDEFKTIVDEKKTNYYQIKTYLDKDSLHYIDYDQWFKNMKDTVSIPLFSKGGIHWTQSGSLLAFDSLMKYINCVYQTDYQQLKWQWSDFEQRKSWTEDIDIVRTLNLIETLDELNLYYADVSTDDPSKPRPNILLIGDSYFHAAFWSGIAPKVFSEKSSFWYYNHTVYNFDGSSSNVSDLDLKQEIESRDIIILLNTVMNLENFSSKFITNAYKIYYSDTTETIDSSDIQTYIDQIKNNPEWLQAVKQKAVSRGIPLDSMIYLDAVYMIKQQTN